MFILFVTTAILFFIFGYISERNFYNPLVLFSLIWLIVTTLASLHLFGINAPSYYMYIILTIGIMSFGIGILITKSIIINMSSNYKRERVKEIVENLNYSKIKILYIVTILTYIPITYRSITLLSQGNSLVTIRSMLSLGEMHSSYLSAVIYNYITQPFQHLLIPIAAINFYSTKKDKKILLYTLMILVCDVLSSGGRFSLLYLATHFIVVLSIRRKVKISDLGAKTKLITIGIISIIAITFYYMTVSRGVIFAKSIYLYICGCIPNMDVRISGIDSNFRTHGFMSVEGVLRPFIAILYKIGIISNKPELFLISQAQSGLVEYAVNIGSGIQFNAFVTLFYYFYIDGGLWGVAIGSFLYSVLCESSYLKMKIKLDEKSLLLFLLFLQTIITSMVRFQFTTLIYALTFIYFTLFSSFFVIKRRNCSS